MASPISSLIRTSDRTAFETVLSDPVGKIVDTFASYQAHSHLTELRRSEFKVAMH
jgi:hypothetical protein